jgi:hypothetical protein
MDFLGDVHHRLSPHQIRIFLKANIPEAANASRGPQNPVGLPSPMKLRTRSNNFHPTPLAFNGARKDKDCFRRTCLDPELLAKPENVKLVMKKGEVFKNTL